MQGCLRQLDFLGGEIELIDRGLAEQALASQEIRRLMTIPWGWRHDRGHGDGDGR